MGKLLWTVMTSWLLVFSAYGQQKTVTGVVTDNTDGLPLIGATIQVKGTSIGAASDVDGKYSISAAQGDILVFRFIGMKTQEIAVGEVNVINISFDNCWHPEQCSREHW